VGNAADLQSAQGSCEAPEGQEHLPACLMANQFTKGSRTTQDEATKDKIRAELLSKRLEKYAKARGKQIAKHHMEPAQVAAAKVLIERGKPALQAIEQRNIEEPKTEQEILASITHLISTNPGLLKPLLDSSPGVRAAVRSMLDGVPSVVGQPHTDCHVITEPKESTA
jgi:hypothetical protein